MELSEIQLQVLDDLGLNISKATDLETASALRSEFMESKVGSMSRTYEKDLSDLKEKHRKEIEGSTEMTESQRMKLDRYETDKIINKQANANGATLKELQLMKSIVGSDYKVASSGGISTANILDSASFLNFMGEDIYSVSGLLKSIRKNMGSADSNNGIKGSKQTKVNTSDELEKWFADDAKKNRF